MKFGKYEINFQKTKEGKKKPSTGADKVGDYAQVTSKSFSTYKNVNGDQQITFDIVEGLYRKTIANRIINKIAGDATRLTYTPKFTDINGNPHKEAESICQPLQDVLNRETIRTTFRDLLLYGDAFIYLNINGASIDDAHNMNPRYINPHTEDTDKGMVLSGWDYSGGSGEGIIELTLEEAIHIANNPLTGEIYGISIFEPLLQVLNLILNSEMNSAIILDKYAIPLLNWSVDSGNPRRKTKPSEIRTILNNIASMRAGHDIGTDASVKPSVIGAGDKIVDIKPILDDLENTFFATAGLPGSLLGFPADNLSAINKQLQAYYETISDLQESLADALIQKIYKPFLLANGIEDCFKVEFSWQKPILEQESRIITWVVPALQMGLIDDEEARNTLGFRGKAPGLSPNLQNDSDQNSEADISVTKPGVQPSNIVKNEGLKKVINLMQELQELEKNSREEN